MFQFLLAFLLLLPTFRATPAHCFEPCDVTVTWRVEEGKGVELFLVSGEGEESTSEREGTGMTEQFTFRRVPAGIYEVGMAVEGKLAGHQAVTIEGR